MSANRLCDRRALCTPSSTSSWLVSRQAADLDRRVDDGHQQRARDQREAQQHEAAQRFGSRPAHRSTLARPIYQGSRCRRFSHSSDVRTMVSMSSSRGVQPSTSRTRSHLATSAGGSPARRGSSRTSSLMPAIFSTLVEHLAHAVAVPVAAVGDQRLAAVAQVVERIQVRGGEILDVDVVAHAGAVGRRVVGAEDRQVGALADRGLAGDLDQQRGLARRLADAALRVGAGDVEVAQRPRGASASTAHRSRSIHSDMSFEVP